MWWFGVFFSREGYFHYNLLCLFSAVYGLVHRKSSSRASLVYLVMFGHIWSYLEVFIARMDTALQGIWGRTRQSWEALLTDVLVSGHLGSFKTQPGRGEGAPQGVRSLGGGCSAGNRI